MTHRNAILSACGKYRYGLERYWGNTLARVLWIMLNPSTADGTSDDPTIRRCIGFTEAWGFSGLVVANLYAYRTPYPKELRRKYAAGGEIIGPENDYWLQFLAARSSLVVCAWGQYGPIPERAYAVRRMLGQVSVLGFTKSGQPRHPLMLPKNLTPQVWQ